MRWCALALLACGCHSVTEIVVRVDSDLSAGASFMSPGHSVGTLDTLCFELAGLGFAELVAPPTPDPRYSAVLPLRTPALATGACLPVELGVVARGDWSGGDLGLGLDFGIEVRAQSSCDDQVTPYLDARVRARFVDGQVSLLPVHLQAACATDAASGPFCAATERCVVEAGVGRCETVTTEPTLAPYVALPSAGCP